MQGPLALIAEVTHRCPLHCVYCSNPLELQSRESELGTEEWANAFRQAAELGTLQVHLTGGEPLVRADIKELVVAARSAKLYVNLITSGAGLTRERVKALAAAGVDHVQLSFQDSRECEADQIAGIEAHAAKLDAAARIREQGLALTLNFVVHRANLDRVGEMIALAEKVGAGRIEIAHVQYYGWALKNRDALLPSREQVERSLAVVDAARDRLKGRMQIDCVSPDYYARFPKPCMGGWGKKLMLLDPAGRALPCHAAGVIPGLQFDNVRERSLRWIWEESSAFQKFRGENWMPQPCRSCDRRTLDFGGCRCQAFLLAGDAARTDPACEFSPDHFIVAWALESAAGMRGGCAVRAADAGELRTGTAFTNFPAVASFGWTYRENPPRN